MPSRGGWGRSWSIIWGGPGPHPAPPPSPIYPIPLGVPLGRSDLQRFTGEPTSGPLARFNGGIFFSPSLLAPSSINEIDIVLIEVSTIASDRYFRPQEQSSRVFRCGPTGTSRTNNSLHRTQPKEYIAIATLIQTTPPGPTVIIRIT
jgi:hypothetical protein